MWFCVWRRNYSMLATITDKIHLISSPDFLNKILFLHLCPTKKTIDEKTNYCSIGIMHL